MSSIKNSAPRVASMRRLLPIVALALVAAVGGCGGKSGASTTTSTSEPTARSGPVVQTVAVSETDFKLNPSDVSIPKTGVVALKVKNDGQVTHSIEVEGPTGESKLPSTLAPGQSGTLKVDFSKPGKYEWYCPVDGHKGMGMKGEITVAAANPAPGAGSGSTSNGGS